MNATQSTLKDVPTIESDDGADEPACACEYGEPGCYEHYERDADTEDD